MSHLFSAMSSPDQVFQEVTARLLKNDFNIIKTDFSRPWGGFFVIDDTQIKHFITKYFSKITNQDLDFTQKLSPKILVVAPEKRLSWQYHDRRAEVWRVVAGAVGVVTSDTDEEGRVAVLNPGDIILLKQGERHRLIGLDGWGVVAEIWQHTDIQNPSNEDDIHRLQDDFGR